MKATFIVFFIFLAACFFNISQAQTTIEYKYDDAGNRTERYNPDVLLKSNTIVNSENSIFNEKTEQLKDDFEADEFFEDNLKEQKITIYPNPTGGELVVQISSVDASVTSKLELYDVSGKRIIKRNNLGEYTDINISSTPSGEYIMHISIGDKTSVWKIIKQ